MIKGTLDQIVQREIENGLVSSHVPLCIYYGSPLTKLQESSDRIVSLEDWRKTLCQSGEGIEVSDRHSFPLNVATCDVQGTWDIPNGWFKSGMTTSKMLPDSALSQLQQLTGAVIIPSSDRHTVYIGASETGTIATVKRKLETLARFFVSSHSAFSQDRHCLNSNSCSHWLQGNLRKLLEYFSIMRATDPHLESTDI